MAKHHRKNKPDQKENTFVIPDYPAFSFEFLTDQSEYNFEYFGHNKEEAEKVKAELLDKIIQLSKIDWKDIDLLSKKTGFELIPSKEVKIKLNHIEPIPEKLYVFRFEKQRCRLIGFKEKDDPIFYVVGFDFDYNAYNHGK